MTVASATHVRPEMLMTDDEFLNDVDPEALAEAMRGRDQEFSVEAKTFAKTHRMTAAKALATVWFRRTQEAEGSR